MALFLDQSFTEELVLDRFGPAVLQRFLAVRGASSTTTSGEMAADTVVDCQDDSSAPPPALRNDGAEHDHLPGPPGATVGGEGMHVTDIGGEGEVAGGAAHAPGGSGSQLACDGADADVEGPAGLDAAGSDAPAHGGLVVDEMDVDVRVPLRARSSEG